ncbi:MAG TPA: FlgD immunoglobulin-like domain containing protein [Candidatus Kapabacteria bacterium]|nr:FlgD immunoglobulin-like domain containing protein [Candidatus Kapabacteria bacterium]
MNETTPTRYVLAMLAAAIAGIMAAVRLGSQPPQQPRTYVGQQTCTAAGCHADAYSDSSTYQGAAEFSRTMHQRIHFRPGPATLVTARFFDNDTILRMYDPRIRVRGRDTLMLELRRSADRRQYLIAMRFSGGGDSLPALPIAFTYGGNGWIERYLVRIDSSYYVPPVQYLLPRYGLRSSEGGVFHFLDMSNWYAIDSVTTEGRFLRWNSNGFRALSWDNNCAMCHVNGFTVKRSAVGADTSWQAGWVGTAAGDSALSDINMRIGCESCHGPGSEHAANPRADNIVSPGLFPHTPAGTSLRFDLCNQCHTRTRSSRSAHSYPYDDPDGAPYQPGMHLSDYIADPYAAMSLWGDGVTSSAHHQQGQDISRSAHVREDLFKNGCWSCHRTHTVGSNGLPFQLDRNWYSLKRGEGCLNSTCHESFGDTGFVADRGRVVNLHTQHDQAISQCVNCHFTRTITIGFDSLPEHPLYDFSDHSFRVIRPNLTHELAASSLTGMINTCAASCHRNGRGSRNNLPGDPAAPSFGIVDNDLRLWKEQSDIDLADSLWYHYRKMYARYVGAVREAGSPDGVMGITSVEPNPAEAGTTIRFNLVKREGMELSVYDIQGRPVRVLLAGPREPGTYRATWDGRDESGINAVAGIYLIRLRTSLGASTSRLVLRR